MKQVYKKYILPHLPSLICGILLCILMVLPTGYEDAVIYQGTDRCRAEVIKTDESAVIHSGLIRSGELYCTVRLLGGLFKGQETEAYNMLSGSLENDKIYEEGDMQGIDDYSCKEYRCKHPSLHLLPCKEIQRDIQYC